MNEDSLTTDDHQDPKENRHETSGCGGRRVIARGDCFSRTFEMKRRRSSE